MSMTLPEAMARVERLRVGWTITREDKADIACVLAEAERAQRLREIVDILRTAIYESPENCPVCHSCMVEHEQGCVARVEEDTR